MSPAIAERETGYVIGGISPFGRARCIGSSLDSSAKDHETIAVSGGQRGLQLELFPQTLLDLTDGAAAVIVDD